MMGLNVAHHYSHQYNIPVNFNIHWYHAEDHLHHFEDPETIVERLEYSHMFYKDQSKVTVKHIFNSTDTELWVKRFRGIHFSPDPNNRINSWIHKSTSFTQTVENKVVIWRPISNAETPRQWKNIIDNYTWDYIIKLLETVYGYHVVELTYRNPISEVYYHLSNCNLVVCYDGMWHYVAKNFLKPMIVFSENDVTKFHTPNAIMLGRRNVQSFFNDFESNYCELDNKLNTYKLQIRDIL